MLYTTYYQRGHALRRHWVQEAPASTFWTKCRDDKGGCVYRYRLLLNPNHNDML